MIRRKKRFFYLVVFLTIVGYSFFTLESKAQSFPNSPLHLHNFNNYYLLNPAAISYNGDPFITLTFHRQLIGDFDNVPTQGTLTYTSPVNVQNPLKHFIGANVYNFSRSIWTTTGGWASYAYEIRLPFSDINTLRFGISAGLEGNSLNVDDELAILDPTVQERLDEGIRPLGQLGIYYVQKHWELGAGLPRLFGSESGDNTEESRGLRPFNNWFVSTGYEFNFRYIWFLKPMVVYRSFENQEDNLEVNATLSYQKRVWFNAAWFEESGIALGAGLQFRHGKYSLSYAYKFNNQENNLNANPAHEIQLRLNLRRQADIDARLLEGFGDESDNLVTVEPPDNPDEMIDTLEAALIEPIEDTTTFVEPEIQYMNYVIVGSFLEEGNANRLVRTFRRKHDVEVEKRFNPANNFYNVYILKTEDYEEALIWEIRAKEQFEVLDAWVLRVPMNAPSNFADKDLRNNQREDKPDEEETPPFEEPDKD